jgi:PKD repeat protein
MKSFPLVIVSILFSTLLVAQNPKIIIQDFLENIQEEQKLHPLDIANWTVTNMHTSTKSGLTHVYIQQIHQGIPVSNGLANFSIKDKKVWSMGNRLVTNLSQKANQTNPSITAAQAIQFAAKQLNIAAPKELKIIENRTPLEFIYNKGGISQEPIPVRLMYTATSETAVKLVWDLSIYTLDSKHYWSVRIDAQDGSLLQQNDWVLNCSFKHNTLSTCSHKNTASSIKLLKKPKTKAPERLAQPDQYTVFALPIESPIHGVRSIVSNPANLLSSPYGWHDTNAVAGAEFTITRGNNVYAYEDIDSNNITGFSPDGSNLLEFNFPYTPSGNPNLYQSAAISNLFYMNNMMHDIWYHYGFDEASGNFQSNNYGRGDTAGTDRDEVLAEAQDNAYRNNASFAVPPDGSNPRMQLSLWNSSGNNVGNYLTINAPSNIVGSYTAADATFGPGLPLSPLTADLVLVEDNLPPINDACDNIINSAALFGKIALIDTGNCSFIFKVEAAQNAGAIAVIIINNTSGPPFQMTGTSANINIPSIMISQSDGLILKNQLSIGNINASISSNGSPNNLRDSDFDNGIIAHEYGHGISVRLTGGANHVNCLDNLEQMGEGWSDWFALMLTIEPGDLGTDSRGIGTYVSNQSVTGQGLRPAPYSTDFAVNPFTYKASNNTAQISEPHGIGFIFATVLWDLNWALIDLYGGVPSPNLYSDTGGNNIAMHLVIEALKIQPCSPGMVDGRNAILTADRALYGGVHECLIWTVFAKRGLGFSADQGAASNRTDQTENFELPTNCQIPSIAPTAVFNTSSVASCKPNISFFDNSTDVPQSWFWDFGDGDTSILQNPTHSYSASGLYTIQLIVSNTIGSDSTTRLVNITNLPPPPIANNLELCLGDTAYIAATGTGRIYWKDSLNRVIQIGDTLCIPNVGTKQTYYAENGRNFSVGPVGASLNLVGFPTYHSDTSYYGALNFTTTRSLEILSTQVDADGAGARTFYLARGISSNGIFPNSDSIIDQVTVNLVDGIQFVDLDLIVPEAGNYNIGGRGVNLRRHTSGANYPYTLGNFMSIDSSSNASNANSATKYYYYFYDLTIHAPLCISTLDTIIITPILSAFSFIDNGGGSFSFSDASSSANTWLWDFGDNTTSTQPNPMHTYNNAGNYTVSLSINNNACTSTQTISVPVGLQAIPSPKLEIKLLPNPTNGLTQLLLNKTFPEILDVQLTDLNGKQIQNRQIPSGQTSLILDLSKFPAAVYFVHIRGNAFSEVRKIIVE